MKTFTEKERKKLISNILSGGSEGRKAIERIYRNYKYKNYLSCYIEKYNLKKESLMDVIHDSFIIFRKKVMQGDFDASKSIQVYITSIAKNLIQNQSRLKRNSDIPIEDDSSGAYGSVESVSHFYTLKERAEAVKTLLSNLGPKCKQIIFLWQQDYRYKEIANIMQIENEAAARKQKFRCFKKLMEIVPKHPELNVFSDDRI